MMKPGQELSDYSHNLAESMIAEMRRTDGENGNGSRSTKEKWLERIILWGGAILLAWVTLQVDVAVLKNRVDNHDQLMQELRSDVKTILQRLPERRDREQ